MELRPAQGGPTNWQNQQNDSVSSEDSDQPAHPLSPIRAFHVALKRLAIVRPIKKLIGLHGCKTWSKLSLGANVNFPRLRMFDKSDVSFYYSMLFIMLCKYIVYVFSKINGNISDNHWKLSHITRKPVFVGLRRGMTRSSLLSYIRRLEYWNCGCADWSAPLLFAYGIRQVFSWWGSEWSTCF